MRPDKRLSAAKPEPSGFYDLARAHIAAHGGAWVVVDRGETPEQWRAWIAYFAWLDGQTTPRGRKAAVFAKLERLTVPAAWPLDFDVGAPPAPALSPRPEPISAGRRRELAAMLRSAAARFADVSRGPGLERPRSPGEAEVSRRHHAARLEELAAEYRAKAPALGPAFTNLGRRDEGDKMQYARPAVPDVQGGF